MARRRVVYGEHDTEFDEVLRRGLRSAAVSVSLLTAADEQGDFHGLAVTTAVPFSTTSPSMIVAVKHSASAYSAIRAGGAYCLNQISSKDVDLLNRFCRSDLRGARFTSTFWRQGLGGLPFLETASASFFCRVIGSHEYGDQTVFVGKIDGIHLCERSGLGESDPLIWINGGPVRLAAREYA